MAETQTTGTSQVALDLAERLEDALEEGLGDRFEVVLAPRENYETLKVDGKSVGYVNFQKAAVRVEIKETPRRPFPIVKLTGESSDAEWETVAKRLIAVADRAAAPKEADAEAEA